MGRKLFAYVAVCVLALVPAASHGDSAAARTLFVTVGQERLRFEAPAGMCFADHGARAQAGMIDAVRGALAKKGDERLLGLFMPCDSLTNPSHPGSREGRVPSFGVILWPHDVEDAAPRDDLARYLDWRRASFREYIALNLSPWLLAADPLRQPGDSVAEPVITPEPLTTPVALITSYQQSLSADAQPFPTTGAAATTLIHGHPVEILIRLNAASGVTTTDQVHVFMDNFMALQERLNR